MNAIRGPDGYWRALVRCEDGQPAVQIVGGPGDSAPWLEPSRTVTPRIDEVALQDLLSRCRGGGVSEHAVTGASRPRKD